MGVVGSIWVVFLILLFLGSGSLGICVDVVV